MIVAEGNRRAENALRSVGIAAGDLAAEVMSYGAIVRDLRLKGHPAPLVLGFEALEPYRRNARFYFGAIVGRWANRIGGARYPTGSGEARLDANEGGTTHLHGGREGYAARSWRLHAAEPEAVTLVLADPDGHMGHPGAIEVRCTYRIRPPATLIVELEGRAEADAVFNPSCHAYFNLADGGAGGIADHLFEIAAEAVLPTDANLVPSGPPAPVAGTRFDFRAPRPLPRGPDGAPLGFDVNFCTRSTRGPLVEVARVTAPSSGVSMTLATTEPGLQLYTGQDIGDLGAPGLEGRRYGPFAGFALEPQVWPDAPNRPDFPQAWLTAGGTYVHRTEYRFARGPAA